MHKKTFLVLFSITSPIYADWTLVEDLEGGATDWVGAGTITDDPDTPANQVYTVNNTGTRLPCYLLLNTPIPEGSTATMFFRIRSSDNSGRVDWVLGSSDVAAPTTWTDYEGYMRLAENTADGDINIDARTGAGFTEVGDADSDIWINVWLVLDNTNDTTDVYYNTSPVDATDPSTLSLLDGEFRNTTTEDLITLFVTNNEPGTTSHIDDFYLDLTGENLTNPVIVDSEPDGMHDPWEVLFFGDLSRDGTGDFDDDNLTDLEEFTALTNPNEKDTDGDSIDDDVELSGAANTFDGSPTSPVSADSDDDGFSDDVEIAANSNPNDPASIPTRPTGFQLVEDFQGAGMVIGQTFDSVNGWTTTRPSAVTVDVASDGSSDQVGRLAQDSDPGATIPISKSLRDLGLQILDGETGTLFMQILASSDNVNHSFGLSDEAAPSGFGDFEAQSVLAPGKVMNVRDSDVFRNPTLPGDDTPVTFASGTWMNVWIVADNESDVVKVYYESPEGKTGQIEITDDGGVDPFGFRNGTSNPLEQFFVVVAPAAELDGSILIDNIYVDVAAENLSRPAPSKGPSTSGPKITDVSFNNFGDVLITFTPGGEGFIVTKSADLSSPFVEEESAFIDDDDDVFIIPAGNVTGDSYFYRIEKQP